VAVAMIGVMIPSIFAEKEGVILKQDENIYINNFNHYSQLGGTEDLGFVRQSIIMGDVVNVSENDLFYVVLRTNIYDDGEKKYSDLEFPLQIHLRSGESSSFAIFPEWNGWDCFELWVEDYKSKSNTDTVNKNSISKKIDDSIQISMTDNRGQIKIKVKNTGSEIIQNVWVHVIKYDEDDNILGISVPTKTDNRPIFQISPGKTQSVQIQGYIEGYKIQSNLDKFHYEKPSRIEIQVEASIFHDDYDDTIDIQSLVGKQSDEKYVKAWQSFLSESVVGKYPSETLVSSHIDINSIKSSLVYELQNPLKQGYCLDKSSPEPKIIKSSLSIPKWIKNNAGWWASDEIDDIAFLTGISYMISNKIIEIPEPKKIESDYGDILENTMTPEIPSWIKNNAGWWADGTINDKDFATGIQYLVKTDVIITR
jgi:hypothetical protein